MASSTKRPRIAADQIEILRAGLEALMPTEPDTHSRREALAKLWQTVAAAMQRGCSIDHIHAHLKKANIVFECSAETIRRDLKTIAEEEAKKAAKKPRRKGRAKPRTDDQSTADSSSNSGRTRKPDAADQQSDDAQRSVEEISATTDFGNTGPAGSASSDPSAQPSDNTQRAAPATSATTQSKEVSAARPSSSDPRAMQTHKSAQADLFAAAESEAAAASPGTRPKSGRGDAEPSSVNETGRSLCVSTLGGEDR